MEKRPTWVAHLISRSVWSSGPPLKMALFFSKFFFRTEPNEFFELPSFRLSALQELSVPNVYFKEVCVHEDLIKLCKLQEVISPCRW